MTDDPDKDVSSQSTRKRIGLAMIIAGPLLAALVVPRLAGDQPVGHGTRIVAFAHGEPSLLAGDTPYQWLPGNRILERGDDGWPHVIDVARQTQTVDRAVENAVHRDSALNKDPRPIGDWVVSPDGAWLLAAWPPRATQADPDPGGGASQWLAIRLDGTRIVKVPRDAGVLHVVWNDDSRGWTEILGNDANSFATVVHMNGAKPYTFPITAVWPFFSRVRPLGHAGPDRLVLALPSAGPYFHGLSIRTDKPDAVPVELRYRLTRFAYIVDSQLSPDGTKLAWLLIRAADANGSQLMRLLPFSRRFPMRIRLEVWESRLDGSDLRRLAMGDPFSRDNPDSTQPQYIRWTPDGKRISYVYKNAIWAVNAD